MSMDLAKAALAAAMRQNPLAVRYVCVKRLYIHSFITIVSLGTRL